VACKSYKLRQSKNGNRRLSVAKWRLCLRLSCEYGTNPGGFVESFASVYLFQFAFFAIDVKYGLGPERE
jgi:hypothetical protein